jgi:predicted lactoylglutathione lyase
VRSEYEKCGLGNHNKRIVMSANITLITLGVADIATATAFYASLGFVKSRTASQAGVSFFRAGGVVAQNVASEAAVDAVMAKARASGARILKPASKTFWGGYNGYFADPDGHVWEVAFNPHWALDEQGLIKLPE